MWYGVYNKQSHQLTYASSGHPPAILLSNEDIPKIKLLKTAGLPIGMMPDMNYSQQVCDIDTSSRLYLFSDGVYEIPQPDQSIWGLNSLIDTLIHIPKDQPRLEHILGCVKVAANNMPFDDDLSLLEIEFVIPQ
jgi:sigma-B regulation protein RsbU (phosphoserine phosphatase)